MTTIRDWVKSLLLPKWDVEVTPEGIRYPGKRAPKVAATIKVDRALCRHTSLRRVPGANFINERQSIRLKAQSTAPFHNADHAILWGSSRVSLLYWDRDRIRSELQGKGIELAPDALILPSTFFEAAGRGIELRQRATRTELQVWEGGAMLLSRLWTECPPPEQIEAFLANTEIGIDAQPAQLVTAESKDVPIRLSWRNLPEYALIARPHLVGLAVAFNVAAVAFLLGGALMVWANEASVSERQASIAPQELTIVSSRGRALRDQDWIETYASVRGSRQHLPLMLAFLDAMSAATDKITMETWEYEKGKLTATLILNAPVDVREIVKALESHRLFTGVNSESNALRNTIKLSLTVVPGGKS